MSLLVAIIAKFDAIGLAVNCSVVLATNTAFIDNMLIMCKVV